MKNFEDSLSPAGTGALVMADRVIAVVFPFLFLSSCVSLVHAVLPFFSVRVSVFTVVVLLSGIASVSFSAVVAGERSGASARVRASVLGLIAVHLGFSVFRGGSVPERLVPDLPELIVLISFVFEWIWAGQFYDFFSGREQLLEAASGKDGAMLLAEMRDDGYLSASITSDRRAAGTMRTLLTGFIGVASSIVYLSGVPVSGGTAAVVAAFLVVSMWTGSVFKLYDDELRYAGMGLSSVFTQTVRNAAVSFTVLAVCALFCFVLTSDAPVFRFRILAWLLALIERFALRFSGNGAEELPEFVSQNTFSYQDDAGPGMFDAEPSEVYGTVLEALKIGIAVVSTVLAFRFLFGTFFSGAWKAFWKDRRLARYVHAFSKAMRDFVRIVRDAFPVLFGGARKARVFPEAASRDAFSRAVLSRLRPGKSRKKKKEIGELAKAFLRVVDWGESRGVVFERNLGPGEYCGLISANGCAPALERIAFLFEKALYSEQLLDPGELKLFFDSVDLVVSCGSSESPETPDSPDVSEAGDSSFASGPPDSPETPEL